MSKELTFKSGSEELRKFCKSADTEAVMERFGKYLDLNDPEMQKDAELLAKELRQIQDTRLQIKDVVKNSLRLWLEEYFDGNDFEIVMGEPLPPEQKKVLLDKVAEKYVEELSLSQRDRLKKDFPHTDQPGAF